MNKLEKLILTTEGWEKATSLFIEMLEKNLIIKDLPNDDDKLLMLIYGKTLANLLDKILGRSTQ
jgi:hypothetical protein